MRIVLDVSNSALCCLFHQTVMARVKNRVLKNMFSLTVMVIRLGVTKTSGVPWPSGLVHWICVLITESSECGFEPRPRPWCSCP